MKNKPFIVNFHEHHMDENADFTVLLSVGKEELEKNKMIHQENPDKTAPFFWINMENDMDYELRHLKNDVKNWGVKGIKFHPMLQHVYPNDPRLNRIYEYCEEEGIIVLWHAGIVNLPFNYQLSGPLKVKYTDPVYIEDVAYDFPDMKIVIAHLGGNYIYTASILALKHRNVYTDTAYLGFFGPRLFPKTTPSQMITHAVNVAGEDKVLYGGEGVTIQDVLDCDISDTAKEKVLGLNAMKLLEIPSK